jgi:hypothetical protein
VYYDFFYFSKFIRLNSEVAQTIFSKVLQSFGIFYFSGSTALNSISTRFSGTINLLILKASS